MRVTATLTGEGMNPEGWRATVAKENDPILVSAVGAILGQNPGCRLAWEVLSPGDKVTFEFEESA